MNISTFITQLTEHCGVDAQDFSVTIDDQADQIIVSLQVPDEDTGIFIGYRGETIQALQRLVRVLFQSEYGDKKIIVNVNDYREQRQQKIEEIAESAAQKVLQTGRPYTFQNYFNSQERFMIHNFITTNPEFSELESVSAGEGDDRRLSIQKKNID